MAEGLSVERLNEIEEIAEHYESPAMFELLSEVRRLRAVLERIAGQDYRGNCCADAAIAEQGLDIGGSGVRGGATD